MNPLVTPSWVASRLRDSSTVLLDATLPPVGVTPAADVRASYLARHLPGAVFFDIEELSDHTTPLPHMLPSAESFAREMSRLGISDDMTIIVYEQNDVFSAPRAWWTLRSFGARDAYLLDGGLRGWIDAGLPVESGPVQRPPATFHAELTPGAVKDFTQVQQMIDENAQILDARSAGRFNGTAPEPRPGIRSGHMPGAINVPYTELLDAGRMKPAQELTALFASKNIHLHEPITTSCGSGVTAAVIALALEICDASDVSLYDGSWAEYAQSPGVVIEPAG